MKEIKTNNFQKKEADLIDHPPVPGEEDASMVKKKKRQYSYQLGKWIWVFEE